MSDTTYLKTLRIVRRRLENGPKAYSYNAVQLLLHKQTLKDIDEIAKIVKEVNRFGGINTLISEAQKGASLLNLFADETPESLKS